MMRDRVSFSDKSLNVWVFSGSIPFFMFMSDIICFLLKCNVVVD